MANFQIVNWAARSDQLLALTAATGRHAFQRFNSTPCRQGLMDRRQGGLPVVTVYALYMHCIFTVYIVLTIYTVPTVYTVHGIYSGFRWAWLNAQAVTRVIQMRTRRIESSEAHRRSRDLETC